MASEYESTGNMGASDRTAGSQAKQVAGEARQKATEVAREARQRGKEKLEKGKEAAASQVQQLAGAVEDAAGRLQNDTLASYASDLGRRLSTFAERLQQKSVDEMLDEARGIARRNPTVFLLGSVAAGVALSRFLKASARRARTQPGEWQESYGRRSFDYEPPGSADRPSGPADRGF
jgi:hypothetical protein